MTLIAIAFFSGILTVLAPCVLPILPIILGASAEDNTNKYTPYIIIASLSVSIFVFSLLLKASTLLIDVPSSFWKAFSGGLIIGLGIITLFPNLWKSISTTLGFSDNSNKLLNKSSQKKGNTKYILMGFALGPVFSSCSPTYALILAIILPAKLSLGIAALLSYIAGLAVILLAITLFGRRLIKNLNWASDPNGFFKKILGVVFICIGIAIFTGYDKKIEAAALESGFLNTTIFEQSIIDNLELDSVEEIDIETQDTSLQCRDGTCQDNENPGLSFLDPKNLLEASGEKITSINGYPAADFRGLENWINSEPIDSIEELKGKVFAVKFWTFSCINCINTLDKTQKLYEKYHDEGFEIIGIHAPEFSYEKNIEEVKHAVEYYGLTFPVVQDNDFQTWKDYNNKYWPAWYLVDKSGQIRYVHFGEGKYEEKDQAVAELLAEKHETPQNLSGNNPATETITPPIEEDVMLDESPEEEVVTTLSAPPETFKYAYFAGGCFWCMEGIFESQDGVQEAVTGYIGGDAETANYGDVSSGDTLHREGVKVVYDPTKISYEKLVELFWTQIDPTDEGGQFADRGYQYTTAIYYDGNDEKEIAESSKNSLEDSGKFDISIATKIVSVDPFYDAEYHHQNYYKRAATDYKNYARRSGRKGFIEENWKDRIAEIQPSSEQAAASPGQILEATYGEEALRARLTPLQYEVTQEGGTERPFKNEYWDNKEAGIYVDIIDGTPLYSSLDKYVSGTGWPSFTQPISPEAVSEHEDRGLFYTRTEIKSTSSNAHVGHVFSDGPQDRGGLRYCMNSAAMRFIPVEELEEEGYGEYEERFE